MIKIFNATDTDFKTAGNIIINPLHCHEIKKKSLNGWYIEVEIPIKYKEYIEADKLCVVKTKSKLKPQAFRINDSITYTNRKIKFTAEHVMFDSRRYVLLDVRPTNLNGQNGLKYVNERTDKTSPFSIDSNVENVSTAYFIRKTLLESWQVFEERWGGVFEADNWDISFKQSIGKDNGETIVYGKNMQGFEIFEDWSNVCTKILPVGYNGLLLPEIYLESETQYEISYTKIVDFQTDLEAEEQTETNLLVELRNNASKYLEENCVPKVSYTVNSNVNNELEIGDTIKVLHPFVNIFTEVLEYEYDLISEKVKSLTFGNYTRDVKTKFNNIKNTIETIKQTVSKQEIIIKEQTNLINSLNKNGYVYIDDNEILILDKLPKEQAKNVWRFGLGGIGFSSKGYEGPFETAITMDGQINAKFITTGTMAVARIEGLANFITETSSSITKIELEQGRITSKVSSVEQSVENITNTQNTATGKNIHLEDSSDEPLASIKPKGETNQSTRSGKNLLLNNLSTITRNGVTATINDDKTVNVNGTNSSTSIVNFRINNDLTLPAGTYKLSGCPNGGTKTTYRLAVQDSSWNVLAIDIGTGVTFTLSSETTVKVNIYIQGSYSANNLLFKPMISLDGGEYEQYGISPSPDFLSPIQNIEGDIEVKVTGKNFEPYQSQTVTFPLAEGQKLMEGSYLADDGIHHKKKQIVLDGTEKWTLTARDNYYAFWVLNTDVYGALEKAHKKICTHFKYSSNGYTSANLNSLCENTYNRAMFLFKIDFCTTVEEWKSWLAQQKANGTPVIVEYELAEEEIVPYTAEQQEAWNKIEQLHTYKNVTNIYSEAELDIVYVRDNGLTSVFATKLGMNSEIKQTKELIDLSVNKKLEDYSTTTEMNGAIKVSAENINSEVKKKVGNNEIISKINQSSEAATIDANRISLKRKRNKFNG